MLKKTKEKLNYYKTLVEKYRDRYHYEQDRVSGMQHAYGLLSDELDKSRASYKELEQRYHDLLLKHTELCGRALEMTAGKGFNL